MTVKWNCNQLLCNFHQVQVSIRSYNFQKQMMSLTYLKDLFDIGCPLTSKRPDKCNRGDATVWPASTLRRVVFPDPDGPIIASSLPGFASPQTFLSKNLTCKVNMELKSEKGSTTKLSMGEIRTWPPKLLFYMVKVGNYRLLQPYSSSENKWLLLIKHNDLISIRGNHKLHIFLHNRN